MGQTDRLQMTNQAGSEGLNWENQETLMPQKSEERKQVQPGMEGGSF